VNALESIKKKILDIEAGSLIYILAGLIPVFILMNRYPYLSILTFLSLLVISIFFLIRERTLSRQNLRLVIWLFLIFLYILSSYFISRQPAASLFTYGFLRNDGNLFFSYLPFLVFAVPMLDYKKALRIYFWFLFAAFALFSIAGLFEYLNGLHFLTVRIDDYYLGPMFVALNNSHNATGSAYAVVSTFSAAFFLRSHDHEKISYGLLSVLFLAALAITKSRGSMVAFAVGVFFVFVLGSGSFLKFLRNLAILIAVAVPLVFITDTSDRILQIFRATDLSALTRFSLWDRAIFLFRQSPLTGVGFARYNDIPWNIDPLPLTGDPGIMAFYTGSNSVFNDTNAHNSYLHFLAETGILGLLLFIVFWAICIAIIFNSYRRTASSYSKMVYLAVMGGIITLFVLALTENYMTAPTVMICLATAASLAIGLSGKERQEDHRR